MTFNNQTNFYQGKVRDVYTIADKHLVMIVSDRISAFDTVLPKPIPYKGQVLNQIAAQMLEATKDIVPNWVIDSKSVSNATIGLKCDPFPIEMVIRGNLTGHAWRTFKFGVRTLCGEVLPDDLKENDFFPEPIITPTTKAQVGHDEDISKEEILAQGLVSEEDYALLEKYTKALFQRGKELADKQGLILVDTKYEFGKIGNTIYLIDEIHTPDSSRFFYKEGFQEKQDRGEAQKQLSKEFVREWLMENGFQGKDGQELPEMTEVFVNSVSDRYIELYEKVTGQSFEKQQLDEATTKEKIESVLSTL